MKILFLTPRDSGKNLGGVERHVKLLTEELVRRGHQVKELSLAGADKSYKSYKNYKDQNSTPIASLDSSTRRKLLARNDAFSKFRAWGYLWEKRDLFRWAEVVHVHDVFWWYAPLALITKIAKLREKREPRVFVTFHGWEGRWPPTRSAVWQKRLAAFLSDGTIGVGSFFEKWYGVKTDRVVWGATDQRIAKIAKISENRESVDSIKDSPWLTPGRILSTRQGRALDTGDKIVFFGRLEEVNGIEVAIRAMELIRGQYGVIRSNLGVRQGWTFPPPRDLTFVFVGDGSWREQAEQVGEVTGMVKEPWRYLVDAEVVIASSYLAIMEAAALGKRIIAVANNPLKRDYLESHPLRGYFEICRNSDELAREIIKSIEETPRLGGESPLRVRLWTRGQTADKLADKYLELWSRK